MTTGTNPGKAASPPPAARPYNDCDAHGVTRPANVPIPAGNKYYFCFKPAMASFISLKWMSGLPASVT
jgi:hypothetical protein